MQSLLPALSKTSSEMLRKAPKVKTVCPGKNKVIGSLEEVFKKIPVKNGMTLSFHHHLRNGDGVANMVINTAAKLGIKDLTIAISSVFPVQCKIA